MSLRRCPMCHQIARIVDSRLGPNGSYCRRSFRCPKGHRYNTIETVVCAPDGARLTKEAVQNHMRRPIAPTVIARLRETIALLEQDQ